ncbi:MAG: Rieske (2Fe-2S) protein [Actinomycetota bacterium]
MARELTRYVVCKSDELQPGGRQIVTVRGREIGVFNVGGKYHAITNRCPHHQAPLCLGPVTTEMAGSDVGEYRLQDDVKVIRCPWHSFEFNMDTGRNIAEPDRFRVAVYKIDREDEDIVVYM